MQYNTELNELVLPEYGRNIQRMVEHCMTLSNREERLRCASTIVHVMARVFPEHAEKEANHPLLWNQLAAMANYQLDIDYPVEIVPQEELAKRPQPIEYPQNDITFRHYGRTTEELIKAACQMSEGREKEELIAIIARHMYNTFLAWGHHNVDSHRIVNDMIALSQGELAFDIQKTVDLLNQKQTPPPSRPAKGKKRR